MGDTIANLTDGKPVIADTPFRGTRRHIQRQSIATLSCRETGQRKSLRWPATEGARIRRAPLATKAAARSRLLLRSGVKQRLAQIDQAIKHARIDDDRQTVGFKSFG